MKAGPKKTRVKSTKPRVRKVAKHRSFKLTKSKLRQHSVLPSAFGLLKQAFKTMAQNKNLFFGISIVYVLFSFVLVQGLDFGTDLGEIKSDIEEVLGERGGLITGITLLGYMVGEAGSGAGDATSAYQSFLVITTMLAVIWACRQVLSGEKPRIRDAYYRSMYPLVPFMILLIVIALQLLPLLLGSLIYSVVAQNELAVTALENLLWIIILILLSLLSAYMITSSIFSLYIVTLPDMTPLKALRSARELVLHRRWRVGLRLVAMPMALGIVGLVLFIPLVLIIPAAAQLLFLFFTAFALVYGNIYTYLLYRALI